MGKFVLYMPSYSGGQSPLQEPIFLFSSVRWPRAVISIFEREQCSNMKNKYGQVSCQQVWRPKCENVNGLDMLDVTVNGLGGTGGGGTDPSVRELGLQMHIAPEASSEP